jgi:hypothetical protein
MAFSFFFSFSWHFVSIHLNDDGVINLFWDSKNVFFYVIISCLVSIHRGKPMDEFR